jgi:methionine-R-sulfoxide reductase
MKLNTSPKNGMHYKSMTTPIRIFLMALILSGCGPASSDSHQSTKTGKQMSTPKSVDNPYYSRTDTTTLTLSDSVWKSVLSDSVYAVARGKATEMAFTGKYWDFTGIGTYYCAACGNKLFRSDAKFGSTCGWPSFFETVRKDAVIYQDEMTLGINRTEVLCGRCGGHLGHVFDDGPPPTGKRFCMNSTVLDFVPDDSTQTR